MKVSLTQCARLALWALPGPTSGPAPEPRDTYQELAEAGVAFGQSSFWDDRPRPLSPEQAADMARQGRAIEVRAQEWPYWQECQPEDIPELSRYLLHPEEDELARRLRSLSAAGVTFSESGALSEFGAYRRLQQDQSVWIQSETRVLRIHNQDELRLLDLLDGKPAEVKEPEVARSLAELARIDRAVSRDEPSVFLGEALALYRHHGAGRALTGQICLGRELWIDSGILTQPERVSAHVQPFWKLRESLQDPALAARALQACHKDRRRPLEECLQAAEACFALDPSGSLYQLVAGLEGQPAGMVERLALIERLAQELSEKRPGAVYDGFRLATCELPRLAPGGRQQEWLEHFLILTRQTHDPGYALRALRKMKREVTRERLDAASWKYVRWEVPELILPTRRRSRCGTREQRRAAAVRLNALPARPSEVARAFKLLFPPERARDPIPTADSFCRLWEALDRLGQGDWASRQRVLEVLDARCGDDLARGLDELLEELGRQSLRGDPSEILEAALNGCAEGPLVTGLEERGSRLIVGGVSVGMRGLSSDCKRGECRLRACS